MFYLMHIYVCAITVEDYVTFLYEGSIYTRYIYYVHVEDYVNLQVKVSKISIFSAKFDL